MQKCRSVLTLAKVQQNTYSIFMNFAYLSCWCLYIVHITIVQGYVRQTLSVEALEVRNSNEETQKKIDRNKRITTQRKRSRCRKSILIQRKPSVIDGYINSFDSISCVYKLDIFILVLYIRFPCCFGKRTTIPIWKKMA
jgi:hypothetical protein